ncbi:Acetyltransferase (GNAT) family protein [Fictibacillus solisalsi]|uniref:Acetyltransferase (GNAT) family protein n=1 Tax=Fictibacillus solisalsi TaxID=459525 RepID=A0A1G9U849_9BACL|nr:GNAT family N-acetyltransferase [Fictibacillus solisalsi]SDM56159.1 Acetyltransferase (GNAT) family protein [Fictibacillus solisalsi]
MEWKKGNYVISTDKTWLNVEMIHKFLSEESYWAKGIKIERVRRAIENTLCFGVYEMKNDQPVHAGFARILTDYVTTAYLCDVFIDKRYRGKGLSKWLVQTIISFEDLQEVRGMLLATEDAHGLYRKYGFEVVDAGRYMKKKIKEEQQK